MTEAANRIPELDGLRGIAILMVMVNHILPQAGNFANPNFAVWISSICNMGWAGVDLFFVLSGFLITSILIRSKTKPHFFRNFYARRVLRIFPIYYVVLTGLFLIYFVSGWADLKSILYIAPWYYSYAHNWLFVLNMAPGLFFGHLWSLAIEEQFYLIWPLIIFRLETKQIYQFGLATMFLALLVRVIGVFSSVQYGNTFPYYATISRIDGLMFGAIIATGFQNGLQEQFSRDAIKLVPLSLALVGVCIFLQPNSPLWNNGAMLSVGFSGLALLSGALVILAQIGNAEHFFRRFLRQPGLLFFGKYSYALYLFHWPVVSAMLSIFPTKFSIGFLPWLLFSLVCFIGTILLSLLSWNLIEQRILNIKRYFE